MADSVFAPDFLSPIGGGHFRPGGPAGPYASNSGGFIDIAPTLDDGVDSAIPTISMDVGRWEIEQVFENEPLECGGNLGATDARLVGYRYMFRCIVIRDINCPPEFKLRGISGKQLVFWYGDPTEGVTAISGSVDTQDRYYWSPDVVLDQASAIIDANGHKTNRDLVVGRFRAHVFLCPEMGTPDDENTIAGAYRKFYEA